MATPTVRFQLDVARYQLFDEGRRVHLERQPMELLILLAKRRGALATRDEIAGALWRKGVHVDVDASINRIVRKLRVALHDDPAAPHFIETVVGKGYRFVGPLDVLDQPASEPREPVSGDRVLGTVTTGEERRAAEISEGTGSDRLLTRMCRKPLRVALGVGVLLLAGIGSVLWTMRQAPAQEPAATALTSYLGDERFPTFSPDGNQVAFAWNGEQRDHWEIYVKPVRSATAPVRLTSDAADDTMPAWSPDGSQIAFERQQGNQFALYVTSPLGGPERRLTDWLSARNTVSFSPPSWTPDGRWLVTTDLALDGQTSYLVGIPTGAGETRRLMSSPVSVGVHAYPVVAPDGKALAYELCNVASICDVQMIALGQDDVPSGPSHPVTHDGHLARGLTWTRDGQSLVYGDGLRLGLRRIPLVGASYERLELAGTGAMFPAIAPLGDRLAYVHSGWEIHLWMFAAGGTAAPERVLASTLADTAPQFSPDGQKIVFGSDRGGHGRQIWVANRDGSSPRPLTDATGRAQGAPRWSPDSRWIVYNSQRDDGHRDISVVDAAGGPARRITANETDQNLPSWSRDGTWIYFGSTRSGDLDVWRIPSARNGDAERVTTAGGFAAVESWDGQTLYYTKNPARDGPVFEKPVAGGPERQVLDSVYRWDFFPARNGLYYITRPDRQRHPDVFELRFLDSAHGRSAVLNRFESLDVVGLSVSPDGTAVLSSGINTSAGDDLVLIQNFR